MHSRFVSRLCRVLLAFFALHASFAFAAPGDRDSLYGNQGGMTIAIPGYQKAWSYRGFLQSDGKLVTVGYVQSSSSDDQDTLVMRFNQDGSPDASFGAAQGTPGRVQFDSAGLGYHDVAWGGVQQPDGSLVVVGATGITVGGFPSNLNVMRLLPAGQLDPSFGVGGRASLSGTLGGTVVDAFVESDGSLTIAGNIFNDFALIRLTSAGAVDSIGGFGVSGIARISMQPSGSAYANRVIKQRDGKYVAAGRVALSVSGVVSLHFAAARFQANGQIDTTFGSSGRLVNACEFQCFWNSVAEQADGKLVFVGSNLSAAVGVPAVRQDISQVARLNADGSSDPFFGNGGVVSGALFAAAPTFLTSGDLAYDLSIDPENGAITLLGALTSRIYNASGTAGVQAFLGNALTRFLPSGQIDSTFGQQGATIVTHGIGPAPIPANVVIPRSLSRQTDGRLIVVSLAGEYVNAQPQAQAVYVARVLASGGDPGTISASTVGPVTEGAGQAVVRVFRHSGSTGPVTVSYSLVANTASVDDFTPVSGTLSWEDGDDSIKLIAIPLVQDEILESADESFSIVLSTTTPGVSVTTNALTLTIARDDTTASQLGFDQALVSTIESAPNVVLTVNRVGSAGAVSISYYTVALSAVSAADYQSSSGTLLWSAGDLSSKEIVIPVLNDTTYDGSKSFAVVLTAAGGSPVIASGAALVSIADDEVPPQISIAPAAQTLSEGGGSVVFEITRTGETAQPVAVSYTTANGNAMAGSDYQPTAGTLTWLPSDAATKTISIPLLDDALHEGISETFTVSLVGPTGGAVLGADVAIVTLVDNDPAPQLAFAVEKVKVNERDGTAVLTVNRTGASGLIHSVDFATRDGSAKAGKDYAATSGTLTWLATDPDTKTIVVPIIRKPRREDNERFFVELTNPAGGAILGLAECKVVITERTR